MNEKQTKALNICLNVGRIMGLSLAELPSLKGTARLMEALKNDKGEFAQLPEVTSLLVDFDATYKELASRRKDTLKGKEREIKKIAEDFRKELSRAIKNLKKQEKEQGADLEDFKKKLSDNACSELLAIVGRRIYRSVPTLQSRRECVKCGMKMGRSIPIIAHFDER